MKVKDLKVGGKYVADTLPDYALTVINISDTPEGRIVVYRDHDGIQDEWFSDPYSLETDQWTYTLEQPPPPIIQEATSFITQPNN